MCSASQHAHRPPLPVLVETVMRKAREVSNAKASGAYTTAGVLSASLSYSPIKPAQLPSSVAIVLWLPEAAPHPKATTLTSRLAAARGRVGRRPCRVEGRYLAVLELPGRGRG